MVTDLTILQRWAPEMVSCSIARRPVAVKSWIRALRRWTPSFERMGHWVLPLPSASGTTLGSLEEHAGTMQVVIVLHMDRSANRPAPLHTGAPLVISLRLFPAIYKTTQRLEPTDPSQRTQLRRMLHEPTDLRTADSAMRVRSR